MYEVAELLETDPNALYELASFYSLLHTQPVGKHVVRVCNGLSCYLRGADPLLDHICGRTGVRPYGTSEDGLWTVEPFECLAACDGAPALMVNDDLYRNMNTEQADALLEDLGRRHQFSPDGQVGR